MLQSAFPIVMLILTALSDGSRGGQVSVLSVHVVGAAARVVTQPDTKVLHLQRGFLMDLNRVNQKTAAVRHFDYFTYLDIGETSTDCFFFRL